MVAIDNGIRYNNRNKKGCGGKYVFKKEREISDREEVVVHEWGIKKERNKIRYIQNDSLFLSSLFDSCEVSET